ncbi:ABC transporter permease [Streptomyces fructofermentans]|uniref:ABC transporter permease n=1 Tax=Streptomyces fructofermentans TaxID=152141 RepID=UPI0037A96E6C
MSTRTGVRPVPAVAGTERRRWAAVFALARFEARELMLQIPVFVFFLAHLAHTVWKLATPEGEDAHPVLQDVDRATQTMPTLPALALLICVNAAVGRSRRHRTDEQFGVLAMEPWRRTVAHLLSAVPFALFTALVVAAEVVRAVSAPGAVGRLSPGELVVGPLTVLLFGVVGALIGRLTRFAPAAVLAAVVGSYILGVTVASALGGPRWMRWLAPVVPEDAGDPLPSDLLGRPAGWHALYLLGLTLLLCCVAVLAGGARSRLLTAAAAGSAVLTLTGAVGQSAGDPSALVAARVTASATPEKVQTCVRHDGSTYCAFPEWAGRTAEWADTVRRVRALAGGAAADTALTVRQRVEARRGPGQDSALAPASTPGQVSVGARWGGTRVPEFAVAVASVLVTGDEETGASVCDGRVVTTMWLALGTAADPMAELRRVRLDDDVSGGSVVHTPTEPLLISAPQTTVVRELLQRPRHRVAADVRAHWDELTAPGTSTARVAELLGVPLPGRPGDNVCGA